MRHHFLIASMMISSTARSSNASAKPFAKPKYRMLPKSYTETDIINFIIGANLRRRDLNPGLKAAIIVDIEGDLEAAADPDRLLRYLMVAKKLSRLPVRGKVKRQENLWGQLNPSKL
jgi:hypothetical protein